MIMKIVPLGKAETFCEMLGPDLLDQWQQELFAGGAAVFATDRPRNDADDAKDREIERLRAKLLRKSEVFAELMDEHKQLTKELGES